MWSEAIEAEIAEASLHEREARIIAYQAVSTIHVVIGTDEIMRAHWLFARGLGMMDAVHLACAEAARADVLLTTDDPMRRRAHRIRDRVTVRVENPVTWLNEAREHDDP